MDNNNIWDLIRRCFRVHFRYHARSRTRCFFFSYRSLSRERTRRWLSVAPSLLSSADRLSITALRTAASIMALVLSFLRQVRDETREKCRRVITRVYVHDGGHKWRRWIMHRAVSCSNANSLDSSRKSTKIEGICMIYTKKTYTKKKDPKDTHSWFWNTLRK